MKNKLLLPHRYKSIGLILLIPVLVLGLAVMAFDWSWTMLDVKLPHWLPGIGTGLFDGQANNLTDELALSLAMIALLLMCFSAEKMEDEFIKHTRLESLQWAVLANYMVLFTATWLLYNEGFWYVMIMSMLTIPIIFLVRFHWVLYRSNLNIKEAL